MSNERCNNREMEKRKCDERMDANLDIYEYKKEILDIFDFENKNGSGGRANIWIGTVQGGETWKQKLSAYIIVPCS